MTAPKPALRLPLALAAVLVLGSLGTMSAMPAPGAESGSVVVPGSAGDAEFHLRLDRSAPEADATLPSPSEIRLWFSQAPQASATSLRLIRDGRPVAGVGELKADEKDGSIFAAPVTGTLPDGRYTVAWRTMAADGHVVRGEFSFTVQAP
ncbi:MAG: copper resistance protein CopC [Longimicrobiales bacterium]|nr:copper resistance protein CopC [Longimicrobiales bacterium]